MIVPAASGRVLAAWAISVGKSKVMSTPALARPNGLPLRSTLSGRCSLPPSQASPSSSGVTATGEKAEDGFDWKKPKPLASSAAIRPRSDTSLTSMTRRIASRASSARRAHRHVVDDDRDLGLEVDAPGLVGHHDRIARAEEGVGAALVHQRIGPEAFRHLGAARLAHQLDVVHVGRAVRPLVGARQRRHARRARGSAPTAPRRARATRRARRDAAKCAASRRAPPAASAPGRRRRCSASGRERRRPAGRRACRSSVWRAFMRFLRRPLVCRLRCPSPLPSPRQDGERESSMLALAQLQSPSGVPLKRFFSPVQQSM